MHPRREVAEARKHSISTLERRTETAGQPWRQLGSAKPPQPL